MASTSPSFFITPLLEAELTASPTAETLERWRQRVAVTADPSTVLGALLTRFEGLSLEHGGVRATLRWFGSTVYAGEQGLFVLVELATCDARVAVLALDRGYDRVLRAPVSSDVGARLEDALREAIEACSENGSLAEAHFFGAVSEFLMGLPGRLVASAPTESLGSWVLDQGAAALLGPMCERPLSRGQKLTVQLRADEGSVQPAKDGVWFAPVVEIRRVNAKAKILEKTEQHVPLGLLGTDTMYEPLPDSSRRSAALEVLQRWKAELSGRIARQSPSDAKSLMPAELPWPTSPLALIVQTLRHGAAGPRPRAGVLGPLAQRTANSMRELDSAEAAALRVPHVVRGYRIGAFTLILRRQEDEDERVEESLWLRRDAARFFPLVFWIDEDRQAFSARGDEPAFRLFAEWMRSALETRGLDRALPSGILPSEWLRLQDRDGEPLDHRVAEGAVSARGYEEVDDLLSAADVADSATQAEELFQSLVRELIDPNARFGQRVAELGLP